MNFFPFFPISELLLPIFVLLSSIPIIFAWWSTATVGASGQSAGGTVSSSGSGSSGSGSSGSGSSGSGTSGSGTSDSGGYVGAVGVASYLQTGSSGQATNTPGNTETQSNQQAQIGGQSETPDQIQQDIVNQQGTNLQLAQLIAESQQAYPEAWANPFVAQQLTSVLTNAQVSSQSLYDSPPLPNEIREDVPPPLTEEPPEQTDVTPGYLPPGLSDMFGFFTNLFGLPTMTTLEDTDIEGLVDEAGTTDVIGSDLVPEASAEPEPEIPVYDPDRCVRVANALLQDPNVSSDFKNKAQWYLGGHLQCDTFFNDVSYGANLNQIHGLTQRQIQLEALGLASEDISSALEDERMVRELQRIEDITYVTEVNTRLSDDVANLGESALDLQQQIQDLGNAQKEDCAWYDLGCHIGEAGRAVAVPAVVIGGLALVGYLILRRKG